MNFVLGLGNFERKTESELRVVFLFLAILLTNGYCHAELQKFACGERKKVSRPYGKVELRVECEVIEGRMWAAEFKGDTLHGFSQGFIRATGKRRDSCFYINGVETGKSLVWDSLGNIKMQAYSKDGHRIGRFEAFIRPGIPSSIKNYDSAGRKHGRQQEWWENGQPKSDLMAQEGQIISGTEYYGNGKPRIRYVSPFIPNRTVFATKTIASESWAPDGRPAGKVVKGQGELLLFSADRAEGTVAAHKEVYKDSLMIRLDELDSGAVAKWLKGYSETPKSTRK